MSQEDGTTIDQDMLSEAFMALHDAGVPLMLAGRELSMRERIEWLCGKANRGAMGEVRRALAECHKEEKSNEPYTTIVGRHVAGELKDMATYVEHLSETYCHFSEGAISKPNTLPSEVQGVAAELARRDEEEAEGRERKRILALIDARLESLQAYRISRKASPSDVEMALASLRGEVAPA